MQGSFTLSSTPNSVFDDETVGDMLIFPATSSQRIHLGNTRGTRPILSLNSSAAVVNGRITANTMYTNRMQSSGVTLSMQQDTGVDDPPMADNYTDTLSTARTVAAFKNYLINGDMRLRTKDVGSWMVGSGYAPNSVRIAVDKWMVYHDTTSADNGYFVIYRVAIYDLPGFTHALRLLNSAHAAPPSWQGLVQSLDVANITDLAWGTSECKGVTLSFWVRLSMAAWAINPGTLGQTPLGVLIKGSDCTFGALFTVDAVDVWERKTVVVPAPPVGSTWSALCSVAFTFSPGICPTGWSTLPSDVWGVEGQGDISLIFGAVIQLTGVQLEAGIRATAFESRPMLIEQAMNGEQSTATIKAVGDMNDKLSVLATYDVASLSDTTVSTSIQPIVSALSKVGRLTGVTFSTTGDLNTTKRQCGVMAQEVMDVLPEAVHTDDATGLQSVAYGNMVSLLIQAVKELNVLINTIQGSIFNVRAGSLLSTMSTSVAAWGPFVQADAALRPTYTASGGYKGQGYVSTLGSRFLQFGRAIVPAFFSNGGFTFSCVYRVVNPMPPPATGDPIVFINQAVGMGVLFELARFGGNNDGVFVVNPLVGLVIGTTLPDMYANVNRNVWRTIVVRYNNVTHKYDIWTTNGSVPNVSATSTSPILADYVSDAKGPTLGYASEVSIDGVLLDEKFANVDISSTMLVARVFTDDEIVQHYTDITIIYNVPVVTNPGTIVSNVGLTYFTTTFSQTAPDTDTITWSIMPSMFSTYLDVVTGVFTVPQGTLIESQTATLTATGPSGLSNSVNFTIEMISVTDIPGIIPSDGTTDGTYTVSSLGGYNLNAAFLFDDNNTSYTNWDNGATWQLGNCLNMPYTGSVTGVYSQIYSETAIVVIGYAMAFHMPDGWAPAEWYVMGSDNGTTWVEVTSRTEAWTWANDEVVRFTFANTTAYNYYRMVITKNAGGASISWCTLRWTLA